MTREGTYTRRVAARRSERSIRTVLSTDVVRVAIVVGAVALIVAHGFWPKAFEVDTATVALVVVIVIVALLPLFESASFPGGGGVVLRKQLDELNQAAVTLSEDELARVETEDEPPGDAAVRDAQRLAADEVVAEVLEQAGQSPTLGLMLLSSELERAIHRLLRGSGWGGAQARWTIRAGVARLVELGVIPASATSAVDLFMQVRNAVVHGAAPRGGDDVLRAVDSGLEIYKAVANVPRERHFVLATHVPLFADAEATQPVTEGIGVMLRVVGPGATGGEREQVHPTTRDSFQEGEEVAWVWSFERTWGATWYRHPHTGEIRHGWDSSAEFIGPPIDDSGLDRQ